jgi:hypothetical protein
VTTSAAEACDAHSITRGAAMQGNSEDVRVKGRASKTGNGSDTGFSQKQIGEQVGLSKRQQVTAVRVANVPKLNFEEEVELGRAARPRRRRRVGNSEWRSSVADYPH